MSFNFGKKVKNSSVEVDSLGSLTDCGVTILQLTCRHIESKKLQAHTVLKRSRLLVGLWSLLVEKRVGAQTAHSVQLRYCVIVLNYIHGKPR